MADRSKRSVYAALIGALAVAAVKFAAFAMSGSVAMLVEAYHSVIDTLNAVLLLLGLRLSARPPDEQHPFGYGMESFFWTFVVGMLIFVAGGVASVYEGIHQLRHPEPLGHVSIALGVLALSFVFEMLSFVVSWWESERGRPELSRRRHRQVTLVQFIHFSPDPGVFEVLAEGIASLLGLILAAVGVIGTVAFGWAWADGAVAIAIGALLIALSGIVLAESKSLLTGEAVSPVILDGVRSIMVADPRVAEVQEVLSMYLGPDKILLVATLDFRDGTSARQIREISEDIMGQDAPGRAAGAAALPSRGRRLALRHQGAPRSNRGMICRHRGVEGCPALFLRVTYQTRGGGSHGYDLAQMNIFLLGLGGPIAGAQPAENQSGENRKGA